MKGLGKKIFIFIIFAGIISGLVLISDKFFETNYDGYYQIKQAAITGNMSVRTEPGVYLQMFGKITEYKIADTYYFSKDALDGGTGADSAPIEVRFSERATANISGSVRFRLSTNQEDQYKLHREFRSYDNVIQSLIRQLVPEAVKNTAAIMKAEESYSSRKAEFISLAERQLKEGIFATEESEESRTDLDGNTLVEKVVNIKYDANGNPIIIKESPLKEFNLQITSFVIKDIDFDSQTEAYMEEKSIAEQEKIVAKTQAEKYQQDRITAEEEGKALAAKAEAEEKVAKVREVTRAEKDKEVAELKAQQELEVAKLDAQKAIEEAKADLAVREAEAQANTLLVKAGLTPSEKAQIDKETSIGVAAELAKIQFPQIMSFGSDANAADPITAIGLNQMLDVIDKISNKN